MRPILFYLYILLIALAGVASVVSGIINLIAQKWTGSGLFLYLSILSFTGIFQMLKGFISDYRNEKTDKKLTFENPDKPWLSRHYWKNGILGYSHKQISRSEWGFLVFLNFVFVPVSLCMPSIVEHTSKKMFYLFYVFPSGCFVLFVMAIIWTIKGIKFGTSTLTLGKMPLEPGGQLNGIITIKKNLPENSQVTLLAQCMRSTTSGRQNQRKTSYHVLWEKRLVTTRIFKNELSGSLVPVSFSLPEKQPVTDKSKHNTSIFWVLKAEIKMKGIDYKAVFKLPVFDNPDQKFIINDLPFEPDSSFLQEADSSGILSTQGVVFSRATDCLKEIVFLPARNPKFLWEHTIGFLISLFLFIAPMFIPEKNWMLYFFIACMAFASLWNGWLAVHFWFKKTVLKIYKDKVCILEKLLGHLSEKERIPVTDIRDIIVAEGWKTYNKYMHNIRIETKKGLYFSAGSNIENRSDAQWLTDTIKETIGK